MMVHDLRPELGEDPFGLGGVNVDFVEDGALGDVGAAAGGEVVDDVNVVALGEIGLDDV
jgi:hypothetical protein